MKYILFCLMFFSFVYGNSQKEVKWADDTISSDDYCIDLEKYGNPYKDSLVVNNIHAYYQDWFTNDSLGETIVYELGTDWSRNSVYHFINKNIPVEIIKEMELDTLNGDEAKPAHINTKVKVIPGFIKAAKRIQGRYFVSCDGFKFGDDK